MPDITSDEFIVTAHVRNNFTGDAYQTYVDPITGREYWTFTTAPNERWVDVDRAG